MSSSRSKAGGKAQDGSVPPSTRTKLSFGPDPIVPEAIVEPQHPRERLVEMLTTYRVNEEKEVFNMKVSTKVLDSLTPQEIRDLRVVFEAFDVNQDDLLPLLDVRRALLSLGFKVSKGEVRNMMSDADLGRTNGEANFNTFLEFVIDRQGEARDNLDELGKSFKLFDIERNGRLTMESLRSLAKQYEVNLKDEEIAMMVKEADTNGDGAVDKDEFVNIMMRTNLFL